MTARRPNVPRAGRPSPQAEERPAAGTAKGQTSARGAKATGSQAAPGVGTGARGAGHQQNPAGPAQSRTAGAGQRRPTAPRAAGPSATKDPRVAGPSATKDSRVARSAAEGGEAGAGSGSTSATPVAPTRPTARQQATPQRPSSSATRSTSRSEPPSTSRSEFPAEPRSGSRSGSHSGSRAAERSQLAGSIRRGRLGSRRAESAIQPAEEATPIPAKSFSGRLLALAVVLIAVIVLLAPSVSRYVQQQAELDALRADIARQQQEQTDYRSELARWDDPAFVKQQARERIFLVMPGETRYLVKGEDGIEKSTGEGSAAEPAELPWADSLWNSITRAATD